MGKAQIGKREKALRENQDSEESCAMDYESFLELVTRRRSTHAYKPDPVPDDYVDKIIEAARWAPSGANSQPWEFIIVKKKDLRGHIVEIFKEQGEISDRPTGRDFIDGLWKR